MVAQLLAQDNNQDQQKQQDDNKATKEKNGKNEKKKTFGGKVHGSTRLYVEAMDLMKFNARYYDHVVHLYAYYLTRPDELNIVFEDYKKNQIILHLQRSDLYNLPTLYKDKLYEIRAKVGKVRGGRLHIHFVHLKPTFIEKTMRDQYIQ